MATKTAPPISSPASRQALLTYICRCLDYSKGRSDFRNRLDSIDYDYYRYQQAKEKNDAAGKDIHGRKTCGNVLNKPVINPIVISQVDTISAYLAEVYLSGYPIMPVVSTPDNKDLAEALEGLCQDHLVMSESIPELQMVIRNGCKYNLYAAEISWAPVKTYEPYTDIVSIGNGTTKTKQDVKHINKIKNLNLRNFHWDSRVDISKLDSEGDYAGYSEIITRTKLKDLLNYLGNEGSLTDNGVVKIALESPFSMQDWTDQPIVSDWQSRTRQAGTNWDSFGGWVPDTANNGFKKVPDNTTGTYLLHTFYIRAIPSDFGLNVPNKNSVQVFKIRQVNRHAIISVEAFTGAQGRLGIFMGPLIEDGFELQTQSYAELATPIQEATTRLFNARFMAANRAIEDRALYNSDMIRSSDINSPNPIAKIAVKANGVTENVMQQAYYSIPFSYQGTEGLLQDALLISNWSSDLTGLNRAQQGQFTKGNRTMTEFQSINNASDNRQRLAALVLEYRFFQKVKDQFKLNILQFGNDTVVTAPRSKRPLQVDISKLQEANLQFEIADGYTPKSKMANTDAIMGIMNLISTSPFLQQAYGSQLPGMLAHIAQLLGIRGFDEYATVALQEWQKSAQVQQGIQQLMQAMAQQMGGQAAQVAQQQQQVPANG